MSKISFHPGLAEILAPVGCQDVMSLQTIAGNEIRPTHREILIDQQEAFVVVPTTSWDPKGTGISAKLW